MNLKALLYRELIFEKRAATIFILFICSVTMLSQNPVPALAAYLYFTATLISVFKVTDMPSLSLLNVTRKQIVRADTLSTIIRQGVFLIIMAIMATISVLAIPQFNESDNTSLTTGITLFALLLFTFAISNGIVAPLKFHKIVFVQLLIMIFSLVLAGAFFATCYLFSSNPTLSAIFNNSSAENITAQLGLLFGSLVFLILSTLLGHKLSLKMLSKMDIRID